MAIILFSAQVPCIVNDYIAPLLSSLCKAFNHGMRNLILNPADYLLYKLRLALQTLNRDNN